MIDEVSTHRKPGSWEVVRLGALVESQKGKKPKRQASERSSSYSLPYINIQAFEEGVIDSWTDGEDCRICNESDFLMVWDGFRSGLVGKGVNGALGSTLVRINFPLIENQYAFYFLQSKYEQINSRTKGSGTPHVDPDLLWNYEFPVPPLNEQRRIVAKLEELFSELDKGVQSIKQARKQLKVYRHALLKHAFEGKLTTQWRAANKDKLETPEELLARIEQEREARYEMQFKQWSTTVKAWEKAGRIGKKPAKPKKPPDTAHSPDASSDKLPKLPEGWIRVRVGSICEVVRGGSPRPAGDIRYYGGTIPFLKVADLTRTAGAYIDTYSHSIKEAGLHKTRLVDPPVLMLSNSGATLGVPKICRIRTTFNDGIAAFLGLGENDLPYHYYFWTSKTLELRAINQGAAQPNLNTRLIQDVVIPLCSKKEMQNVARDIGKALSKCDRLNADIDIQLARLGSLRQSILKRAFSGQLVAQDPDDEPASALLARIQAERANAPAMKRTSR